MNATQLLHNLGQRIWLDNITRNLLDSGTLEHYIDELSVTGLTSNPTIFDHAIKNGGAYNDAIRVKLSGAKSGETLFFELALDDITRAAALFRPVYDQTDLADGWVSLEGAKSFVQSWNDLMAVITAKSAALKRAVAQ
jgi:transaldolase